MSEEKSRRLREIKRKHRDQLMSLPNVSGVGIGRKVVGGKLTERFAIRIYVTKKVPKERLKKDALVPSEVEGVPTDVVQIGKLRRLAHTFRARPARGGDSIGDCTWVVQGWYTAGTLGGLFIDNTDGAQVILSNNHVIAESDDVTINVANVGDDVVQPGTMDCGDCATDVIANLKRWQQYQLPPQWNRVDAAIAEVVNVGDVLNDIHDIGPPTGHRALTTADEGVTTVQKSGRTTEYTQGLVFDVDFDTTPINMGQGNVAQFEDQILIQPAGGVPFSLGGDSGSLVLDMDSKIVGLLFAGSCDGWAVANHFGHVLGDLDIRLPTPVVEVCVPLTICLSLAICYHPVYYLCGKLDLKEGVICLKEGLCVNLCPAITPLPPDLGGYRVIDLDKIPPKMRRSVEKMLEEIRKHEKG